MRHIKEILRLKYELKLTNGLIARSLRLSKSTVSNYLSRAKTAGIIWPLPESWDHREINQRLFKPQSQDRATKPLPDFAQIHLELKKKGVTLQLLWEEYRQQYAQGYQYTQFCHYYHQWAQHLKVSMRQTHKAGEKGFIDYVGSTFPIVDPKTGQIRQVQLFVFVLGASNYTYAEATESQQLPHWIESHLHAFEYFGGIPKILVPDNLKSGVTKPNRYEPEINRSYQDMAAHYGTVVIPARVRKPKDKAKAEGGVLLVQRWILAALRHRTFYSIAETNEAIWELLTKLNHKPMQKLKKSRHELFLALDKPALLPLPAGRYQFAEFKHCRVNIDYHIEVDHHYYSVPYQLVGQRVEARFTSHIVEVFSQGKRVASHRRSYQPYKHTTLDAHMPKSHRRYAQWTPLRIIHWGQSQGEAVGRLCEHILQSKPHPEQGFRSCLGLIRLSQHHGRERLNQACERALALRAYSYKSVQNILKNKLEQTPLPSEEIPPPPRQHENVRGNHYYGDTHDLRRNITQNESDEVLCNGPLTARALKSDESPGLKP
jgi:transposase